MTQKLNQYLFDDTITEEEFLNVGQTGDIVLFKTNNFGAKMQRRFTNSKFDHVGMIIRFEKEEMRIFDAK